MRELQRSHLQHLNKVKNMKPGIDMKPPASYPHVQVNAKRAQMVPPPHFAESASSNKLKEASEGMVNSEVR